MIVNDVLQPAILLVKHLLRSSDDGTLGTVAIGLVLTGDSSHRPSVVLHQYNLAVVLGQIDGIEALLHLLIESVGLPGCLQVCQQDCFLQESFLLQIQEPAKKGIRRGEGRHIDVGRPRLSEYPGQQPERVQPCAEIRLQTTPLYRLQHPADITSPAHQW